MVRFSMVASAALITGALLTATGCGASEEVTVSGVDDSVVHSEADMQSMEDQNAADMGPSN